MNHAYHRLRITHTFLLRNKAIVIGMNLTWHTVVALSINIAALITIMWRLLRRIA
jgi:Na+-transporting NADH:ubiquinone oxidoreductase subunit NqrE